MNMSFIKLCYMTLLQDFDRFRNLPCVFQNWEIQYLLQGEVQNLPHFHWVLCYRKNMRRKVQNTSMVHKNKIAKKERKVEENLFKLKSPHATKMSFLYKNIITTTPIDTIRRFLFFIYFDYVGNTFSCCVFQNIHLT